MRVFVVLHIISAFNPRFFSKVSLYYITDYETFFLTSGKILIIGGGIANFTNVSATFAVRS